MLGDAHFLSFSREEPGWSRYFTAPHWQGRAVTPDGVWAVLDAALRRSRDGEWLVFALAYEAAPAFDPGLAVHAPDVSPETPPLFYAAAYGAPSFSSPPSVMSSGPVAAPSWRPLVSRHEYDKALAEIRECLRLGEAYQVNYTFPLAGRMAGDPAAWFAALAREQDAGFSCRLDLGRHHILSFSPELFFSRQGDVVVARPMKGTMPRGRTAQEDAAMAASLAACPKNRAENRMIADLLRNDLGRAALPGSVAVPEMFAVERLRTAWQMTSTVTARVPPRTGLAELLTALFPCGSITGAPKKSAMAIIRRLEPWPRGFYTGAIGHVAPGGDCVFNVAIRTVTVDRGTGQCRFGVGGGVTYDSTAADEYEECRVKAAFLSLSPEPFELLETLRLAGGRYVLLPEHLARLRASAAYYGFPCSTAVVDAALDAVRQAHPRAPRRVRLLVSREGRVRTESFPLTRRKPGPLRLGFAARPVDAASPDLFHKTTRRGIYDRALAAHPDCDDVLLRNRLGQVTESCRANVVAALSGRLVTPPLSCGLLPGTYRERLLRRGVLVEGELSPADLASASRLWLINSVRFWMPAILAAPACGHGPGDIPPLDDIRPIC